MYKNYVYDNVYDNDICVYANICMYIYVYVCVYVYVIYVYVSKTIWRCEGKATSISHRLKIIDKYISKSMASSSVSYVK